MVLLLLITCWIVLLVLVTAVCLAARLGDEQEACRAAAAARGVRREPSPARSGSAHRGDAERAEQLVRAGGAGA
jgi:hypothetical protein